MKELSHGRRVYMFLSDKYLHSANCMNELHQLWLDCRYDDMAFMQRTRVYVLPCAKIWQIEDRLDYALHWKRRVAGLNALLEEEKPSEHTELLGGDEGRAEFDAMTRYVGSVAKVLHTVKDKLQTRNFDEFERFGLDDIVP